MWVWNVSWCESLSTPATRHLDDLHNREVGEVATPARRAALPTSEQHRSIKLFYIQYQDTQIWINKVILDY